MLVLSRKAQERILIGDDIEVTVIEIRGDKVRLGFTAPKDVRVIRPEVIVTQKLKEKAAKMPARPNNQTLKK